MAEALSPVTSPTYKQLKHVNTIASNSEVMPAVTPPTSYTNCNGVGSPCSTDSPRTGNTLPSPTPGNAVFNFTNHMSPTSSHGTPPNYVNHPSPMTPQRVANQVAPATPPCNTNGASDHVTPMLCSPSDVSTRSPRMTNQGAPSANHVTSISCNTGSAAHSRHNTSALNRPANSNCVTLMLCTTNQGNQIQHGPGTPNHVTAISPHPVAPLPCSPNHVTSPGIPNHVTSPFKFSVASNHVTNNMMPMSCSPNHVMSSNHGTSPCNGTSNHMIPVNTTCNYNVNKNISPPNTVITKNYYPETNVSAAISAALSYCHDYGIGAYLTNYHRRSAVQGVTLAVCSAGCYIGSLLRRVLHRQSAVQGVTSAVCSAGCYIGSLLCRVLHRQSAVQGVTSAVCSAGCYIGSLQCRVLHWQSAVQGVTLAVCSVGCYIGSLQCRVLHSMELIAGYGRLMANGD